jgi:hypothetical protein
MEIEDRREDALWYAKQGIPIFPLFTNWLIGGVMRCSCGKCAPGEINSGKHPNPIYAPRGFYDASCDPAIVDNWWRGVPNANIGLPTGRGTVVVDTDPRNGGNETLAKLQAAHGAFPRTCEVLSGGGGPHFYFKYDKPLKSGKLGPGVDLKADGGYVVAPPSRHLSGNLYEWRDRAPRAALPVWIAQAKPARATAKGDRDWQTIADEIAPNGSRRDKLLKIIGHLSVKGVNKTLCYGLMKSFNQTHCAPPLEARELEAFIEDIWSKDRKRRLDTTVQATEKTYDRR